MENFSKTEFVEAIAREKEIPKTVAQDLLNFVFETIQSEVSSGKKVQITGFGSFSPKHRKAREARNPQNPEEKIQIPETTVPYFKAGKVFKDVVAAGHKE